MWNAVLPCLQTSGQFMAEMQQVIDHSSTGLEAGRELLRLRQGTDTVSNYTIEFQMLATDSGWEGRALIDAFLHGLAESVKNELLTRDLPDDLDCIVAMAILQSQAHLSAGYPAVAREGPEDICPPRFGS